MRGKWLSAMLVVSCMPTGAFALVRAYSVEPRTAAMSGKVSGNPDYGGVGEVVTCCWGFGEGHFPYFLTLAAAAVS